METMRVAVDGGTLSVLRFGSGPRVVLAAHGITGNGMSFATVAGRLPADWTLLAVDLRGRGLSSGLAGEGGLAAHARDLHAVAATVGAPVVLTGHSMGAYIALLAAAERPDLYSRLILIDGGLPLPVPPGADLDQVLAATLGPALERLGRTFESADAYVDFFRAHPALGPHWNPDIEAYVRHDTQPAEGAAPEDVPAADRVPGVSLGGASGAVRPRAQAPAVRADGHDLLTAVDAFADALRALPVPTLLLTATAGMFGDPPGFIPEHLVATWQAHAPALRAELVPDTNHYTIILTPTAAAAVAERITDPNTWPAP